MNNDVTLFLKDFAAIIGVEHEQVTADFPLEQGNWDSVEMLSTMALIDERCNITLSGGALQACTTVGDVLRLAGLTDPAATQ